MIQKLCHLYILLKQKQQLLRLLWIYDMTNIDLQTELLKVHYELKEVEDEIKLHLTIGKDKQGARTRIALE